MKLTHVLKHLALAAKKKKNLDVSAGCSTADASMAAASQYISTTDSTTRQANRFLSILQLKNNFWIMYSLDWLDSLSLVSYCEFHYLIFYSYEKLHLWYIKKLTLSKFCYLDWNNIITLLDLCINSNLRMTVFKKIYFLI